MCFKTNHNIFSNDNIDYDSQYFETLRRHNHSNMSLIVKYSKSTTGSQKTIAEKFYISVKKLPPPGKE